jgi:hypothetical protein
VKKGIFDFRFLIFDQGNGGWSFLREFALKREGMGSMGAIFLWRVRNALFPEML